jgi:hypothetical protein
MSYVEMGGCPFRPITSRAVSHILVAEQPAPARKRASCSLAHLSSWPALTSVQWSPRLTLLEASLSSASLNFSDSRCLKEALSSDSSSVADNPRMKPVDSSASIGNLPRRASISVSDSWEGRVP